MKNQVVKISEEFQEKFNNLQRDTIEDCRDYDGKREILYDLDNVNSVSCGLGCQLHGISAAFVCAFENNRKLNIINYQQNQYAKYFNAFGSNCMPENERNISRISSKQKKMYFLLNCYTG